MGTIVTFRNVKIMIYTHDHDPPHVHVQRGAACAKIEIATQTVLEFQDFSKNDLRRITEFIASQQDLLSEAWDEIHKKD
jgi:hypothetical protein